MEAELKALLSKAVSVNGAKAEVAPEGRDGEGAVFDLCPHEGVVFLQDAVAGQELMHIQTFERYSLPSTHRWMLSFDKDGFGVVEAIGAGALPLPMLVEDLLRMKLCEDQSDALVIVRQLVDKREVMYMDELLSCYTECSFRFACGGGVKFEKDAYELYKCLWVRGGARVFFACRSLYERLGFKMFGKEPWRWGYKMLPLWHARLCSLGFNGHCQFSVKASCSPRCNYIVCTVRVFDSLNVLYPRMLVYAWN
jgi:hypothetical protein